MFACFAARRAAPMLAARGVDATTRSWPNAFGNALGESLASSDIGSCEQRAARPSLYSLDGNSVKLGEGSTALQDWSDDVDQMILNGGSGRDQAAGWASASTADATGGLTPGAEMKPWVMSTREKATAWFGSKVGDSRAGKVLTGAFDAWLVAPEMLTRVPDIVTAIPSGIGRLADATVSTAVDLWNDPLGTATGAIGSGVDGLRAGFNRTVNGDGLAMGSALFAMGTVSVPLGRLESGSNLNILRQTGAGGLADPADAAYALIRSSGSDVATIAENTGIKASNIQKVKDHIFYNEHFLDRYESLGTPGMMKRFDSNQEMADAWKRLEAGTFILRDMQLLKHETAEAWYMKKYGPSYNNSHNAANRRYSSPLE